MDTLYLDYCATTPLRPEVLREMVSVYETQFGNPSSLHEEGRKAKQTVELARARIAQCLDAKPTEVIFTSSGTEANNLAIFGALAEYLQTPTASGDGIHVITSELEHPAAKNCFRRLERLGVDVTWLPVPESGVIRVSDLEKALRNNTKLVSVMMANNEVGTLQPVADIAALCRPRGILVHTDAVQAVGKIPVSFRQLGVDLLTCSAHKFYGPKGVGILIATRRAKLQPILFGGGQERGLRSSTENVPAIHGAAVALDLALGELAQESKRLSALRDQLADEIALHVPDVLHTVSGWPTLPHVLHICLADVLGEAVVLELDRMGVHVSAGSACSAGTAEPSAVLQAMGVDPRYIHGSLRISLGRETHAEDIPRFVQALHTTVHQLRGKLTR